MKYTTKISQAQFAGKIRIEPKGGELNDAEVKAVLADPWGKWLIEKGLLTIEGVKPSDIKNEAKDKKAPAGGGAKLEEPEIKISGDAKGGKQ